MVKTVVGSDSWQDMKQLHYIWLRASFARTEDGRFDGHTTTNALNL